MLSRIAVLNGDATEVFTRPEIEQAHVQFYSTLFSEEQIDFDCKQHCLRSYKKVLTQEQCDLCEGPLMLADLTSSLKSRNLGKSPGSDGLTIKFYLHSWDLLGPLLLHVARVCFNDGSMSDLMKGSISRLIYKKKGGC